MSLLCSECDGLMGPSEELPGNDGVMIRPVLLSFVWATSETEGFRWELSHVMAKNGRSLCFGCITQKVPKKRKAFLANLYETIHAETNLGLHKMETEGQWRSLEDKRDEELYKAYRDATTRLDNKHCLFCGAISRTRNQAYLLAQAFDRAYCRQFRAGFPGEHNYSITNHLPGGAARFTSCFMCLKSHFPRLTRILGADLQRKKHSPEDLPKGGLFIAKSFMEALRKEPDFEEVEKKLRKRGVKIGS